jgi:hypothetical protein
VLADPGPAGVHRGGQFGDELLPLGIGELGYALRPGLPGSRGDADRYLPNPVVDDRSQVACPGKRGRSDSVLDDPAWVEPGCLD